MEGVTEPYIGPRVDTAKTNVGKGVSVDRSSETTPESGGPK